MTLVTSTAIFVIASLISAVEIQAADFRDDPNYLDQHIKHIDDSNLFKALNLELPALAAVKNAVEAGDYNLAYRAWADYWDAKNKVTLIEHDGGLLPIAKVEAILRADPALILQIEKNAEPLMRHKIRGWGNVTHQHGYIVDFNYDYGSSGKYGFHYWGWSKPILTAFHATGDVKYITEFDLLFNQWYEQRDMVQGNINGLDVIWYELGLGLRNRKFLHYYTCPFVDRPTKTHERMLKTALGAARWLYELEKLRYRTGNWQIMGSTGLVDIAVRLPEFAEAEQWLDVATQRLVEHVEQDFYEDGCHSERVPTSYMGIAYRDSRNLVTLLHAAGVENESVQRFNPRLEKVLEWWMLATNPLGGLPALNDGSSRSLPVSEMRRGAALYDRPDFLYVADLANVGKTESARKPPAVTSTHLEPSGVVIMRNGWKTNDNYLFLNYGTHDSWHTHHAILDFELFGNCAPLALDAGLGQSYDDPLHNSWYTRARAHNMLVLDEANVNRADARGHDIIWHSDSQLDFFAATHDGYLEKYGLTHRRAIVFIKPDYFVISDFSVAKSEGKTLSWYFHSPTSLTIGGAGRITSSAGPGVQLIEAWPDQLSDIRKDMGMNSLAQYGGRKEINWIAYDKPVRTGKNNRFAVLMYPFKNTPPEMEYIALPSPPGTAALKLSRTEATDYLIFGNGERLTLLDGKLVTDGAFAWVREDSKGQRVGIVIGGGEMLTWDGNDIDTPIGVAAEENTKNPSGYHLM